MKFPGIYLWVATCILMSACSADKLDKNNTTEASAQTFELVRSFQRVLRYDCSGRLLSDQIETVSSPTKLVEIEPATRTNLNSSSFVNLTNGSSARCIVDNTKFNIDYAPGWCNIQVVPGANQIQYAFNYCAKTDQRARPDGTQETVCIGPVETREQGSLFIRVTYREETLAGSVSVRPSAEECAQKSPKR